MKKSSRFFGILIVLVLMLLGVELFFPKPIDWTPTFSSDDKIPFGTFVIRESLPEFFPPGQSRLSRSTLYEMKDSLAPNILIISAGFDMRQEDVEALLKHVWNGGTTLIASTGAGPILADTLGYSFTPNFRDLDPDNLLSKNDSILVNLQVASGAISASYRRTDLPIRLVMDSLIDHVPLAVDENGELIAVRIGHGDGFFVLSCAPAIHSNYYVLNENTRPVAAGFISLLPYEPVNWAEYYSRGRGEATTPLRLILSKEALRWAYYVTMASLVLFVVFEAKRRQRPIPILIPVKNESLGFVKTVGNLYFEQGNHGNIAHKKIAFLFDQIRSRFNLDTNHRGDEFNHTLAARSGNPILNVEGLFTLVDILQKKKEVSAQELQTLNQKIEKFLAN